ncbi:MAG: hypothetical protein ABFR62_04085 [Bacteroidota bacterium]
MREIKIVFSIILFATVNLVYSQVQVGLKFDINGVPFNGYFDPLSYSPKKNLTVIHRSDSYEVGYYYDSFEQKKEGLIKFENDKIYFKKYDLDSRDKIKPSEIESFVIGVDSFFVVSNFYYKNKIKTEPEFVKYITEFNDFTFAKHYHFTSGLGQAYAMRPPIIETFLVKEKGGTVWVNFQDNNIFKERALKYFGHIPYLEEKITSGSYTSKDMLSMIKIAEYYYKYQNSELICYDKYWQEINNSEKAQYTARITSYNDSIWTLDYYNDSIKLYTANYSSFYPNTKDGEFTSYFSDGKIRQIIRYKNNKAKEVRILDKKGGLKRHYGYQKRFNPNSSKVNFDIKYISVADSIGDNLIEKGNSNTSQIVVDDFDNYVYNREYYNKELVTSYRLSNGDKVFQLTDPAYNFKIKSLQKKLNIYMLDKKYNKALSVDAQGVILLSLVIDKKGYPVECKALNGIHPEIDKLVDGFVKEKLLPTSEYRHKFKAYKKDKTKQFLEVVIPIVFSTNRFYRTPVNYFNNFNNMHLQMQMQQQMMMNSYRPPAMPARF